MKKINNILLLIILVVGIIPFFLPIKINLPAGIALIILSIILMFFRNKLTENTLFICLLFILLAGIIGSELKVYDIITWYDTLIHFISGIISSYFAFLILKKFKIKNKYFNIIFIICFASFIASSWEIFEFTLDNLIDYDAQRVIETGVTDTMKDIICALFGSLLFIINKKNVY